MRPAAAYAIELAEKLEEAVKSMAAGIAADIDGTEIPGVRRLSANAFTVKSSMISESWLPSYWDARSQKRRILEGLSGASTLDMLEKKLKALLDGKKEPLHPVFKKILQDALDEIVQARAPR